MPSITQELAATRTARWYREAARSAQRSAVWNDRLECYEALAGILTEHRAARMPGHRRIQPLIRPPALLTEVARRRHFSSAEPVYRRWRAKQNDQAIPRWAGSDPAIKPVAAFVAEAKIVTFWPYRAGVLQVSDAFDMTLTEVAAAYLRALAAWAGDMPEFAACEPAGPPDCVPEDLAVLARRFLRRSHTPQDPADLTARLAQQAADVVGRVLDDASLTPLGAFNTIRDEVLRLLTKPSDPIAARMRHTLAELADGLLHESRPDVAVTPSQKRHLEATLKGLSSLLAKTSADMEVGSGSAAGEEGDR